jgi:hypothetical protein
MRRVTSVLIAVIALVAAACGGDGGAATTSTTASTTTSVDIATTTTQPTTTTTVEPTTTTTQQTTTTSSAGVTTTTLAGKPIDFGPAEGDPLMVIGVRHDDVLNLRAGPGVNSPIQDEIPPTFTDVVALGNTRELPSSLWVEVDYEGTDGWVNLRYVGYEGDTTDDTARIIADLGETPVESTMTDLGELVAGVYASDGDPKSVIVQVTPVTTGDLAEVTYDVIGLGDDAVAGVRIHVFAEPVSGGFSLKSVEVTAICGRGVDDGACV